MTQVDYTLHYARYHSGSSENFEAMERYFARSLAEFLPADHSAPILDVGCGIGFALSALSKRSYTSVAGIDADAGQVAAAKARGLDARHVPLESFDAFVKANSGVYRLVLAFDVLEHVPVQRQIEFIRGIYELLQVGGIFVCQVPNALSPVASYQRYIDWTHHCAFTTDSLEFALRAGGLEPVASRASIDPVPLRRGLKGILVSCAKSSLRAVVRSLWRLVVLSEIGIGQAIRAPVSRNLVMVAKRPASGRTDPASRENSRNAATGEAVLHR